MHEASYAGLDDDTRVNLRCGDLAEASRLPRELIVRLHEMWERRSRPFFSSVGEDGLMPPEGLAEVLRSLKVSSTLLCDSVARVISGGAPVAS